jgi:hypothetical protein
MNDTQPWEFTCKTCGDYGLTVSHVWSVLAGSDSETWQEWGALDANHLWHFEFKEKIEEDKDDEVERGDFSEFAEDDSDSEPEIYEVVNQKSDSDSDKFYVNCANCDREIEFGWSESNRGGGIFPVECSDFIPGKIWPEPRYLDSWQNKGWLQKADAHV